MGNEVTFSGVNLIVIISDRSLEIEYESNYSRDAGSAVKIDIKHKGTQASD